jgi:hypothetical protein
VERAREEVEEQTAQEMASLVKAGDEEAAMEDMAPVVTRAAVVARARAAAARARAVAATAAREMQAAVRAVVTDRAPRRPRK